MNAPSRFQQILTADNHYKMLDDYFTANQVQSIFLVCGSSIQKLALGDYFQELPQRLGIAVNRFSDFSPNPVYESVEAGVAAFRNSGSKDIVAVGGGSALDVAKCIKLYANMNPAEHYLHQVIIPNDIRLLAVPTTAGTGSEATRYAVIYCGGEKQSVTHDSCIPSTVLFDPSTLSTLPDFQKKATMLDALCHAVEAMWSVNATSESRAYSEEAIGLLLHNCSGYLAGDALSCQQMLQAANIAGKAINITQTTAGHAMCYKLTSLYGLPHGYAAALCVNKLWPFMLRAAQESEKDRLYNHLRSAFDRLARAFSCAQPAEAANRFSALLDSFGFGPPHANPEDLEMLVCSVNATRLKNNPVQLDSQTIRHLYQEILGIGLERN